MYASVNKNSFYQKNYIEQYDKHTEQYNKPPTQQFEHQDDELCGEYVCSSDDKPCIKTNILALNSHDLKWEYADPTNYYDFLLQNYGHPDVLAPQSGGIAIWNKSIQNIDDPVFNHKNIFSKFELRDELVEHRCPAQHTDFLYSYLKIPILPEQLEKVIKLSGSVNYDPLKNELFARCGSLEANIMTLFLVTNIIVYDITNDDNYMSIEKIHNDGEYIKHINKTTDANFVKEIYGKLSNNIDLIRQSQSLPIDYWPGAFGEGCLKPDN